MPEIQLKPLPPKEAIAYFRQKGYKIGFDYRDVWRQGEPGIRKAIEALRRRTPGQDVRAGASKRASASPGTA